MIILLFFLLFWCGLSIKYNWIIFLIPSLAILIIILRKHGIKYLLIGLSIFAFAIPLSFIYIDNSGSNFQGIVTVSKNNYLILLSKFEKIYIYQKEHGYEVGDYLSVKGQKSPLTFNMIESQFDFKHYLNKQGVKYELEVEHIEVKFKNPIRLNQNKKEFLANFPTEVQAVVSTLLFGNHEDGSVTNNLEFLHLSRLVSMSGFYIYVFLDGLSFLFSFLLKKKYCRLASLAFLIPYFIFTYPRFAVIRIFVMELARWINTHLLNKKISTLNLIGIVGLFFLTHDITLGAQESFIMGFSLPILSSFLYQGHPEAKPYKIKLISTLTMYLILLPFELKFYNGINPLMLLMQYALTPLMMLFSFSCLICFYKIPIYPVVNFFYEGIEGVTTFFKSITFIIPAPAFNAMVLVIYALLFIAYLAYRALQFIPLKNFCFGALLTLLVIHVLPISNLVTNSVSFINVGQGDSCLIRTENTTVLIDTGGSKYMDVANDTLIPYLRKNRIYDIDLVITTHDDYDHSGALEALTKGFKVKNYIKTDDLFPITVGGITFHNYNNRIDEQEDENDRSLVIGFELSNKHYLIMGDASTEIEANIMEEYENIPCDILKVGHHGSKTSTSSKFVGFLSPDEAIVSVGRNYYGHPTPEVLTTLRSHDVKIRRTDQEGTISYTSFIWA